MKRFPKWLIVIAVLLVAAGAAFAFMKVQNANAQSRTPSTTTGQGGQTTVVRLGSITESVSAIGAIRARQSASLNFQATGKVGDVKVQIGQKVNKDDVLATLDPTSLPQNLIQAQSDLITAKQNLQNLYDNAGTTSADAMNAVVTAQQAVTDAQNARDALNWKHGSQLQIDNALSAYNLAVNKVTRAMDAYHQVLDRDPTDPIRAQALSNLTSAQLDAQTKLATYNWYVGTATPQDIAQADANLAVAKSKLVDAQRALSKVQNGPSADDIKVAQNQVDIAQAEVNATQLTAPFSGVITDVNILPGDMVATGSTTAAVRIDDLSSLLVDLQVTETDINNIKLGQAAQVTFDAIPNKTYDGKVSDISQVGVASSGVVYFTVTVELTNADTNVKPGMTASANVITSQVDNVLLVPTRAIRTVNNQHEVFVPDGKGGFNPVRVQLGAVSGNQTQILSGVTPGERIEANAASATATTTPRFGLFGIFGGNRGGAAPAGGANNAGNRQGGGTGSNQGGTGGNGGFNGGGTGGNGGSQGGGK